MTDMGGEKPFGSVGISPAEKPFPSLARDACEPSTGAPHETPDAVISAGLYTYGRPYGLDGVAPWRRWIARIRKRKPTIQRFLLRIIYRGGEERCTVVHFDPGLIRGFLDKLLASDNIRSVECAELLFKGRKSFGSDYDPANFLAALDLGMQVLAREGGEAVRANPKTTIPNPQEQR